MPGLPKECNKRTVKRKRVPTADPAKCKKRVVLGNNRKQFVSYYAAKKTDGKRDHWTTDPTKIALYRSAKRKKSVKKTGRKTGCKRCL